MSRANPRFHRTNPSGTGIIGNGVVRYTIVGKFQGVFTFNLFDYSSAIPSPTQPQLAQLLTAASTTLRAKYLALVSSDWVLQWETISVVHRNDIMGQTSTSNSGLAGGRAAGTMPTEVSQPLIKQTALKGQHGRGRIELPAIATADVTGSAITAAAWITAAGTFCTAMLATISDGAGGTYTPCVSQRQVNVHPPLVIAFAALTSVRVSVLLGTSRRRKINR